MKKGRLVILVLVTVVLAVSIGLTGCDSDAAVAARNVSVAADQFEIYRRVVFYNGITGDYILVIEGRISIGVDTDGDLAVTIKTEDGRFLKHYLGLSDNVTYFAEQLTPAEASTARYRVIFKPSVIVPNIDLE